MLFRMNTVSLLYNQAPNCIENRITSERNRFSVACARLDSMNPLRVLSRGYSIVRKDSGAVVKSSSDVASGDKLTVRLQNDSIKCTVD